MSRDMQPQQHQKEALHSSVALVINESHDWRQLCQQVCQNSGAASACFVFFSDEKTAPLMVKGRDWPLQSHWTTADYQAVWQDNNFFSVITSPDADQNYYLAVPIRRGTLKGLLLLNYVLANSIVVNPTVDSQTADILALDNLAVDAAMVVASPSVELSRGQCQLLNTLATQGALLWQEKLWQVGTHYERVEQASQVASTVAGNISSRDLFKRLKKLFQSAPILINAFDARGRCILWNQACERVYGWSCAEVKQHPTPFMLFYPDAKDQTQVVKSLEVGSSSEFKVWHPYNRAGRQLTVLWAHISLPNGGALCVGHDISEQADIENQQLLAANVFESSYDGIVISDAEHRITHLNAAFTRITGFVSEDIIGRPPYQPTHLVFEPQFYSGLCEKLKTQDYWHGEAQGQRKNGEHCALRLAVTVVKDDAGKILNHVTTLSDITHLKQYEENLKHQAFHDALTGIPNRLLFGELLERAINTSERNQSQLAICYLDLDGFKAVNDNFGHAAGDKLLIEISRRLSTVTRGCDAVARLGGDEFALLFSGLQSSQEYESILKRVQKVIRQPVVLDEDVVTISASIGVALYPQDADQAELLLRFADQAMYQAKAQGKNAYVFFDAALHQQQQSLELRLEQINQGFRRGEFLLYYQPAIDLQTHQVVRLEALLRWSHPELGLLTPADFLSVLMGSHLELEFGLWVIEQILEQMQLWHTQGLTFKVSFNVGAGQLLHADFIDELTKLLALYPASFAQRLELEFQENVVLSDIKSATTVLQGCRDLGISMALDNFGTGYASLNHLNQLPLDTIKIDRSFINGLLTNSHHLSMVESVIQLAATLKLAVTAEGVEQAEQSTRLQQLGCFQVQGYGISQPMPVEQVSTWLQNWESSNKQCQ